MYIATRQTFIMSKSNASSKLDMERDTERYNVRFARKGRSKSCSTCRNRAVILPNLSSATHVVPHPHDQSERWSTGWAHAGSFRSPASVPPRWFGCQLLVRQLELHGRLAVELGSRHTRKERAVYVGTPAWACCVDRCRQTREHAIPTRQRPRRPVVRRVSRPDRPRRHVRSQLRKCHRSRT